MSNKLNRIEELGVAIADALGSVPNPGYRDAYLSSVEKAMHRRRTRAFTVNTGLSVAMAAAVLMTIGTLWVLFWNDTPEIEFYVGSQHARGTIGNWMENTYDEPVPILFENGSRFQIGRNSAARVVQADETRVRVILNRGALSAQVNGNGRTEWEVTAGPYTVTVLGTRFAINWDTASDRFTVNVTRGKVSVSGGELGAQRVTLTKGQFLYSQNRTVHILKGKYQDVHSPKIESPMETSFTEHTDSPQNKTSVSSDTHHEIAVSTKSNPSEMIYASHAVSTPVDSSAISESHIRDRSDEEWGENDLWHMANQARHDRRISVAFELYSTYRKRFPGTERAATAAFLLGKSSLDILSDSQGAYKWLSLYLKEMPDGFLREEALGRLIIAAENLENSVSLQHAARQYLTEFPKGAYAKKALAILQR